MKLEERNSSNAQIRTLLDLEIHRKKIGPDYNKLKTLLERSFEPEIRHKNFGARNGNYERNAMVKNQGTKQRVQRIIGDGWKWSPTGSV